MSVFSEEQPVTSTLTYKMTFNSIRNRFDQFAKNWVIIEDHSPDNHKGPPEDIL